MRLQLGAGIGVLAAAVTATPAHADDWVGARNDVYADEWIVVVSPAARGRAEIADRVVVEGGFALDVLSGATPVLATDAVTSATYFSESRRDSHLSITYAPAERWDVGATGFVSVEPDHITASGTARGRVEVFQRMTTLALDYSFLYERVGTVHDPELWLLTTGHVGKFTVSQILSKRATLTGVVSAQYTKCEDPLGCQANPYRVVPMLDDGTIVVTVPERHADQRLRTAAALRLSHHLGRGIGVQAGYRFYADTWKVTGHTGDAALVGAFLDDSLVARLEGRFTWQEPASFFSARYSIDPSDPAVPEYRTADRELARLYNVLVGARLEHAVPRLGPVELTANARLSRIWYRYLNYPQLPRRNAWLMGVGVNGEF